MSIERQTRTLECVCRICLNDEAVSMAWGRRDIVVAAVVAARSEAHGLGEGTHCRGRGVPDGRSGVIERHEVSDT